VNETNLTRGRRGGGGGGGGRHSGTARRDSHQLYNAHDRNNMTSQHLNQRNASNTRTIRYRLLRSNGSSCRCRWRRNGGARTVVRLFDESITETKRYLKLNQRKIAYGDAATLSPMTAPNELSQRFRRKKKPIHLSYLPVQQFDEPAQRNERTGGFLKKINMRTFGKQRRKQPTKNDNSIGSRTANAGEPIAVGAVGAAPPTVVLDLRCSNATRSIEFVRVAYRFGKRMFDDEAYLAEVRQPTVRIEKCYIDRMNEQDNIRYRRR
jgi:hypothetical protein